VDDSVWFVVVPWLAFGAGLVGFYFWLRTPLRLPRPTRPRLRRRVPRDRPDEGGPGGEHDADLGRCESPLGAAAAAEPGFYSTRSHV
jgi:hypothetical protein